MTFERTGTGTGVDNSIPKIREQEGKGKKHSQNSGTRKGMKIAFPKFRHVKGTKKLIPIIREGESEAFCLGNGWEREFPLTPDQQHSNQPIFNETIKSC